MDFWKQFDQNPVTHSVAHHVVAIADLIDEFGYARVSDVARLLQITRGSVSVTLKNLKQRGLVTEDERRFLGLSSDGRKIADSIRAKKRVLARLLIEVLGVPEEQALIDTCKIEHLISATTAERAVRLLRLLHSGTAESEAFREALAEAGDRCDGDPSACPVCEDVCLARSVARIEE